LPVTRVPSTTPSTVVMARRTCPVHLELRGRPLSDGPAKRGEQAVLRTVAASDDSRSIAPFPRSRARPPAFRRSRWPPRVALPVRDRRGECPASIRELDGRAPAGARAVRLMAPPPCPPAEGETRRTSESVQEKGPTEEGLPVPAQANQSTASNRAVGEAGPLATRTLCSSNSPCRGRKSTRSNRTSRPT
jgi:hypothetical protein